MPAAKKHQVYPIDPRDLVCDTCPKRYPWADSALETTSRARVAGWHVYDGPSVAGTPMKKCFCPSCFKTGAPQRPNVNHVLPGQLDLPGLFTPVQVPKSRRNNREMS